jgi:hypothetical protein
MLSGEDMAMRGNLKSLLGGAATAALLILPAVAADNGWVVWPSRSYNASSLKIDDIVGTVNVRVTDGPMTVDVSGAKARVNGLKIGVEGGVLKIDGSEISENESVWNWHDWFNFPNYVDRRTDNLTIKISVPRGTNVDVNDLVGDANIGDTQGALRFEAAASKAVIGRVASANISLGGSGKLDIAAVTGELKLEIGGSGKVNVGPTGDVHADIAGSGTGVFGPIAGGLHLSIAGSGDVTAARVNGPVHVDIAGSGSVKIADGTADPLHLDIMGAGNFTFGGVAVDPHIDAVGSGSVRLKSYRGHMDSEGMADVKVGD